MSGRVAAPVSGFSAPLLPSPLPPSQFLTLYKCPILNYSFFNLISLTFSCPLPRFPFFLPASCFGSNFAYFSSFTLISLFLTPIFLCLPNSLFSVPFSHLASISPSLPFSFFLLQLCCRARLARTNFRLITVITSINERGLSS